MEVAAIFVKLADLRDELARGEVPTVAAACRLSELLASVPNPFVEFPVASDRRYVFPRWTFGGYCTMCMVYACQSPQCAAMVARYQWEVCTGCKGSGYRDIDQNPNGDVDQPCSCVFGAVEVPAAPPCPNPDDPGCCCPACRLAQSSTYVVAGGR